MDEKPKSEEKLPPQPILATTRITNELDGIVAGAGTEKGNWHSASLDNVDTIPKEAGVYCFVLPEDDLPKDRRLILHGRTFGPKGARRQLQITFHYAAAVITTDADLVLYVGKAAGLRARLKGHLSTSVEATTNQVLRGLLGKRRSEVTEEGLKAAKKLLVEKGTVFYYEHHHENESADHAKCHDVGENYVVERDLLEIKLIAKYAPPFNLKAER